MSISIYDKIGGASTLHELVEAFYSRVVNDPDLSPLFAMSDLDEVKRKQSLFLTQFLGGPSVYSNEFGHPMLRYRHMPFEITTQRATSWLRCMQEALDELNMDDDTRAFLIQRFTQVAHHMVNQQ
jgi:hemoglobin